MKYISVYLNYPQQQEPSHSLSVWKFQQMHIWPEEWNSESESVIYGKYSSLASPFRCFDCVDQNIGKTKEEYFQIHP